MINLCIITANRAEYGILKELIKKIYKDVNFKLELVVTGAHIDKKFGLTKKDWFVGDTGHDINTGKKIGVQTCAVLSGFMSKRVLTSYSPDLIIEDFTTLDTS